MLRPKFPKQTQFQAELHRRVDQYFEVSGKFRRDCPRMYLKTSVILAWFFTCYILLVFTATVWWTAIPLAILLGLATAAIGFNIQHDAGHMAYSNLGWMNKLMSWTIDMVGGSSYMWHWKHGVFHHTFTNIDGHDDDIDLGFLGRLSPHQKRYFFHRWQHYYLWVLYGLVLLKWHLFDDFFALAFGRVGKHRIPRPMCWNLAVFVGGKLLFLTLAVVLPICFHTWWQVLLLYGVTVLVTGVVLSAVFQLAHCEEQAAFPMPSASGRMHQDWAIHQVATTVNFAPRSRMLTWFLGGLNFQVEHHLFPRICHTNYPALSRIVQTTCAEFGLPYHLRHTLWSAIQAHYRWLRSLGAPELRAVV